MVSPELIVDLPMNYLDYWSASKPQSTRVSTPHLLHLALLTVLTAIPIPAAMEELHDDWLLIAPIEIGGAIIAWYLFRTSRFRRWSFCLLVCYGLPSLWFLIAHVIYGVMLFLHLLNGT